MLPKYYCPECGKLKNRFQVKYRDDTRSYWYECKWCHKVVIPTRNAIEQVLGLHNNLLE